MTLDPADLEAIADRNARIVSLAKQGVRPRDIAKRFGVSAYTVTQALYQARMAGEGVPNFRTNGQPGGEPAVPTSQVSVARSALVALKPHADKRGMTVKALARRIVELVAEDDLVTAVLDDQGEGTFG